ncbi:MAG: phosphatidate cytidylyltransferase [Ignavibacteria bacterium]|nr:phosphatidate cytidylyltransferase [Ignavibacteria bacterium]
MSKFPNLLSRVLVSVVAIPLILLIVYLGKIYFALFVAAIIFLTLYEFFQLAEKKGANPDYVSGFFYAAIVIYLFYTKSIEFFLPVTFLFIAFTSMLNLSKEENNSFINLGITIFGALFLSLFYSTLIGIREKFEFDYIKGAYVIMVMLASIWICDSAAYFGGTAYGKHRLFERISPKKSVEGAIFGFVFAILTFVAGKFLLLNFLSWFDVIYMGLVVGVIGQIGDLVESMFKRDVGVKDSSNILPGHGGILDRFDSLLFVSPFIYFYLNYAY